MSLGLGCRPLGGNNDGPCKFKSKYLGQLWKFQCKSSGNSSPNSSTHSNANSGPSTAGSLDKAALCVVRFLKSALGQGILLHSDEPLRLLAYCDSDWLAAQLPVVLLLKQHTVSRSSAEAEYRSMAMILCELKWLRQLLVDFQVSMDHSIPLYCDSQAAIDIVANRVFHERTKHIELDCHFVRNAF
ncbi:hypothetical protein M9H77_32324 [Catharanthus roseus]|uniref:Uncharacterized protein n=1 Tax=Catharanthus roseus TaxID=4058 RepID=A0ACC0A2L9_CATRO|nr:hypothetical protein M9H77_32324 [Catharanthus roseus]